jgi:outer membrane lipoprotein carrier protein
VIGLAVNVSADSKSVSSLKMQLTNMQSFRAKFSQTLYGNSTQEVQSSAGVISVQRPRKFRWQLTEPYPQLIVTGGRLLYIYDPDLEQVQVRNAAEALKGTPALLLAGDPAEIDSLFEVVQLDPAPDEAANSAVYSLSPRQTDSLFSEIRFFFVNGIPESIEIRDALGQLTRVEFSGQDLNTIFPSEEFEFEIPQGVDVIGNAEIPTT